MSTRVLFILLLACVIFACGKQKNAEIPARPVGAALAIKAPLGLPPLSLPADNPLTADAIALGRKLYFEKRLSSDNTFSCGSCHSPYIRFADGLKVASGVGAQQGRRNTPTVLNAAYHLAQFWDGRAASLEQQAGMPIANPIEMNMPHDVGVTRLSADPTYQNDFAKVFGPGPITMDKIQKAIASFERTLLSGNAPFDRYQYGGEKNALTAEAIRGLAVFTDKQRGNCVMCHTIGERFALFTDDKFHNLGAGMDANGELKDVGRFAQTNVEAERGAFRIIRSYAHKAAEDDAPDFPIVCENLGARLGITLQGASRMRQKFVRLGILAQTVAYRANVAAARYRWLLTDALTSDDPF